MELRDLIDQAFRSGCETSLDEVLQDERYIATFREFEAAQAGVGNRFAYTVGSPMLLASIPRLLEAMDRKDDAVLTELFGSITDDELRPELPELHALIFHLGERLVETAARALSDRARSLAAELKTATVKRRQVLLREIGEELLEHSHRCHERAKGHVRSDRPGQAFLPGLFTSDDRVSPNCLGLTQMAMAIARESGLPALLHTPVELIETRGIAFSCRVLESMFRTLARDPGRTIGKAELIAAMTAAARSLTKTSRDVRSQFHSGVLIGIDNDNGGRPCLWFGLDPYQYCWGTLPSRSGLVVSFLSELLQPFRFGAPGLVLQVGHSRDFDRVERRIYRQLKRSIRRELPGILATARRIGNAKTADDYLRAIMESRILDLMCGFEKRTREFAKVHGREALAKGLLAGFGESDWARSVELLDRLHLGALRCLFWPAEQLGGVARDALIQRSRMHPIFDISEPYFALGYLVLSDLATELGDLDLLVAVSDFSAHQKALTNACLYGESPLAIMAAAYGLNCRHPLLDDAMHIFNASRNGLTDGQESGTSGT